MSSNNKGIKKLDELFLPIALIYSSMLWSLRTHYPNLTSQSPGLTRYRRYWLHTDKWVTFQFRPLSWMCLNSILCLDIPIDYCRFSYPHEANGGGCVLMPSPLIWMMLGPPPPQSLCHSHVAKVVDISIVNLQVVAYRNQFATSLFLRISR